MVDVKKYFYDTKKFVQFIFSNDSLMVIFELLNTELSEEELFYRLNFSNLKFKLIISKLIEHNIVEKTKEIVQDDQVILYYSLNREKLQEIVKYYDFYNKKLNLTFESKKCFNYLKNGFKELLKYPSKPYEKAALFIKSDSISIEKFKEELNELITKFINKNNVKEKDVFMFMPVLLPYNLEDINSVKKSERKK